MHISNYIDFFKVKASILENACIALEKASEDENIGQHIYHWSALTIKFLFIIEDINFLCNKDLYPIYKDYQKVNQKIIETNVIYLTNRPRLATYYQT